MTSSVKSAKKRSTRFIHDDGRYEVRMKAWVALKPCFDLRMLVSGVIILDQMNVEVLGRLAINLLQEP